MSNTAAQAPAMAREVLGYFLRHPHTVDDLEAVARWRIKLQNVDDTFGSIVRALRFLVQNGYLSKDPDNEDPSGRYSLNASRRPDAERFISSIPPATSAASFHPPASREHDLGSALLARVRAWLDAALLCHHHNHPAESGDFPGLTRSPISLEGMLGGTAHQQRPDTSAERQQTAAAFDQLHQELAREDAFEPLALLHRRLGLSQLELQLVLLCLAPELDAKYQVVFGIFNDDLSRRTVTLGMACSLLGDPSRVRCELLRSGAFAKWQLLEPGALWPYADEPLRLDGVLLAWLLGDTHALLADVRCRDWIRSAPWPGASWAVAGTEPAAEDALRALLSRRHDPVWIGLVGPDPDSWRAAVQSCGDRGERRLVRVAFPAEAMPQAPARQALERLARALRLLDAVPTLDGCEPTGDAAERLAISDVLEIFEARGVRGVAIVPSADLLHAVLTQCRLRCFNRALPSNASACAAFAAAASDAGFQLAPTESARLAATYPLALGGILQATRLARLAADSGATESQFALISSACRRVAAPALPRFARSVEPVFSLDDVVLPDDRRAQLDEIVSHVLHAGQVMNGWGFGARVPYGRGIAALFFGASGTGKTMAALALARKLETQVYMVDLSRVVSKYIGESEKHLDAVFEDAERAGAVLLFDEADALFGKRSEIKDAHDRYANIEVAYLLQRIEAFRGLAILTTNFRQNVDQAFLRRLRFVIEFPKPDASARERIWRQCLPAAAPCEPALDLSTLARKLDLSGSNIGCITMKAAFAAASDGSGVISMRHIVAATRAELRKLGMPIAERDFSEIAPELERRVA